ncbi:Acetyl-CoA acetyltransferase [Nocardioides sp. YR527]|uniref:thiolase C-terminal domain-containing protein n=1 Tax=Nocardioides sp. YR527 TaxID=1881028 RepID=UPI00088BC434|nr:thiolase [Nocardioides sp. YR527]SDL36927.1 Acetyl-CoA acetyltransferase [Nocardioides sp. YR527]
MSRDVVIMGAAETDIGKLPTTSTLELHVEGARRALADANLTKDQVDGIASVSIPGPIQVAHSLGITPTYVDGTGVGGSSFLFHVRHATAAIKAGYADVVLVTHGESGRSRVGAPMHPRAGDSVMAQFEMPYGITGPPTSFTVPARRFLHETDNTLEQLAEVAVAQRRWASRNPRAMFRDEISVDDVLGAKMIADPFTLLMCCLVTDGGGALVVASREFAEAHGSDKPLVHILGTGEAATTPLISQMEDMTRCKQFTLSSQAAFKESGTSQADIDHLMIYDAFAHVPLYGLEDMGFVGRGESGAFVAEGNTSPGGSLPLNTNGGGMSYTHTGMYGMFAIQESVRQLRGEAAAQVDGAGTSLVLGNGGMFMSAATLILANQR